MPKKKATVVTEEDAEEKVEVMVTCYDEDATAKPTYVKMALDSKEKEEYLSLWEKLNELKGNRQYEHVIVVPKQYPARDDEVLLTYEVAMWNSTWSQNLNHFEEEFMNLHDANAAIAKLMK